MVLHAAPAEAASPLTFPRTEAEGVASLSRMSRTGYARMVVKFRTVRQA